MTLCYKRQPSSDSILEMCESEKSLFFNSSETTTSSNTTNDYDLSSTSSFATDARLQNKFEWEQIERIFYAEEPLPEDAQTRQEFKVRKKLCIVTILF